MHTYNTSTLEEVFLLLCKHDEGEVTDITTEAVEIELQEKNYKEKKNDSSEGKKSFYPKMNQKIKIEFVSISK